MPKHTPDEIANQLRKILNRNLESIDACVFFLKGQKFDRNAIMGTKAGMPKDVFFLTGFMVSCLLSEIPVDMHEQALRDMIKGHHEAFITGRGQLLPGWEIKPTKSGDPVQIEEKDSWFDPFKDDDMES